MTTLVIASPTASPTVLSIPGSTASFPKEAVEACLRSELIEAVKAEAGIKGIALPSAPDDAAETAFQVDSLVVVSILCALDPIVGCELPDSVVRTGGYSSISCALEHLLPRIEAQWKKKGGKQ